MIVGFAILPGNKNSIVAIEIFLMNTAVDLFSVPLSYGILATYIPLFLAMISLLKFEARVAGSLGGLSVVAGLLSGLITPLAVPSIFALVAVCYCLFRYPWYSLLSGSILFVLCAAIFVHKLPGFNNPMVIDNHQFTADSIAYSMYLNFDKAIMGLVLLIFMRQKMTVTDKPSYAQLLGVALGLSLISFVIAVFGGLVAWSPKFSGVIVVWGLSNLFITCVAEEVVFRGFIQRSLQSRLQAAGKPPIVAVILTAVFFGAVHAAGGPLYIVLAALMGFGYGYVYFKTGQLRWAIGFHFVFNLIHITFFSYPILA